MVFVPHLLEQQPFGSQASTQSAEPHQPGLNHHFVPNICAVCCKHHPPSSHLVAILIITLTVKVSGG